VDTSGYISGVVLARPMLRIEIDLEDCEDVVNIVNMIDELFTFVRKTQ
jgi:hypothetical protein